MRILHITSHLNTGGITSYILSLSKALVERGHRAIVASGGGEREGEVGAMGGTHWRVPLHTKAEFSPQVFRAAAELSRRLSREPVEILHAHTRVAQVVAHRLSRRHRIPYVATWHGFFRQNLGRRLWPCTGDATIAISEPVRQHLLRGFHLPAERVQLIPHGIDAALFESASDPGAQQRLRNQLGLSRRGHVIGTVARLVPSRHIDHLIEAFVQVRASIPEAQLVIVGDGPSRPELERLARARGAGEQVHFAGTLQETPLVLSLMSIFVFLPAEAEGFGLSLLEAMASGRPIVAIRRGGGAEWVLARDGIGLMVEPGDVGGLAQAIVQRLRDGETACRAAGKGRAIVKERYALSRAADQVEALYQRLVTCRA